MKTNINLRKINSNFDEINAFDQEGLTALHKAAIKGDKNTVRTLLSKGANIDLKTQDDNGCTALHIAAAYGNNEVVQFLCENGADISSKDNLGYTPFYYAVEKDCVDGSADLVNSFASKISLSNARGSCENTPNTDLIFKESFFTNLSEAAKAENQNEKNDRQPYFLVSPAYVYNHRGQVLAELQRYKQMQFVTAEFHTDPFSEIKNIIAQANQSSDNKLSDQEIGLAILLAIRNNGISGTKTAQTSCQNDLQNKSLIATVLGEDYAPENQAELMQKIQNFSIAFQKAAKTHKFFTGNENAKEIVGMRLKRINPEIALDFILNSQNQSHAAARSNNFERAKILTDFDIENRLELHEITPSPSTSSPSISAVQANASLRYK